MKKKKRKINDIYNKKQNELQSKYEEIEKRINSEEEILINKKNVEFLDKEEIINKSYNDNISIKLQNAFDDFNSLINKLDDKIIKNSNNNNNFYTKIDLFKNIIDDINHVNIIYYNEIKNLKDSYKKAIKENNYLKKNEIKNIKTKYEDNKKKNKYEYNSYIYEIKSKRKNELENVEKEKDDFNKNRYKFLIKIDETIKNTYIFHKSNYFNVKNIYNLMYIYYNDDEIYNNVVINAINNSINSNTLLDLIEKKKNKNIDDYIKEKINQNNFIKNDDIIQNKIYQKKILLNSNIEEINIIQSKNNYPKECLFSPNFETKKEIKFNSTIKKFQNLKETQQNQLFRTKTYFNRKNLFFNDNIPNKDMKNPNINIENIISIKKEYNYPPKIGLKDLGEASYMNSILQCFCQIEKIVNYFKYNNRIIDIIKIN